MLAPIGVQTSLPELCQDSRIGKPIREVGRLLEEDGTHASTETA